MSVYNLWGGKPGVYRDDFRISAPIEGKEKPAYYASEPMYIRSSEGEIVYRGVYFRKAKKHCIDVIGEPVSFTGISRADVEGQVAIWVESVINTNQQQNQEER